METWKKIEPELWRPLEEGDEISGILIGIDEDIGKFGSTIYHIETEAGKQLNFFGSTVLTDKMKYVKVGDKIKIVFKGKRVSDRGEYNDFDVFKSTEKIEA